MTAVETPRVDGTAKAIEVTDLTKEFGDLIAVDRLSFSIDSGQIFGFLGPNGSGKSTTIRMLCGVLHPSLGSASVFGLDVVEETEKVRTSIGYMSQRFELYNDLTIDENLNFYGEIYGLKKDELEERKDWIKDLALLKEKESVLADTLSGGWKQRLALACAFIHNPKLLILDEPTAGVDPVSRRVFWDIIKSLPEQGTTVLITTHYMDEAELCDKVGFIFSGRLIELDEPQALIQKQKAESLEDVFITLLKENAEVGAE